MFLTAVLAWIGRRATGALALLGRAAGFVWSVLRSIGDVTTNAVWTNATASVAAGTNVQFRIQVSDGAGPGDLIEAGIDDVSICPQ